MKLKKQYLSELTEEKRNEFIREVDSNFGGNSAGDLRAVVNAWEKYSSSVIDTEIVTDENDTSIYDYRIFDPHHHGKNSIYTNFDGWSNWLCEYRDNEGNDIDVIFDEYDGEAQI